MEFNFKGKTVLVAGAGQVYDSPVCFRVELEDQTVYGGIKAALDGTTRTKAFELSKHNIRVNCVNPTVVMTEMDRSGCSDPAKGDLMKAKISLGRFSEAPEVVDAILFLLSDNTGMISGVTLPIDGVLRRFSFF